MTFAQTPLTINVAALRQGQTYTFSWGRITRRSALSLEVWETESQEHYLVGYNPQHPQLIDIVSLFDESQPKERIV